MNGDDDGSVDMMNAHGFGSGGPDGSGGPGGSRAGESGRESYHRKPRRIRIVAALAVALAVVAGLGVWLWAGRTGGSASIPYPGEVGAYELPAQTDRRYTRADVIAMVDDCNEQATAAGVTGETTADGAADAGDAASARAPFAVEDEDTDSDVDVPDTNAHPPTTITLTIPASESAEPLESQSFRCMAKALAMPERTQRDLVTQSKAFNEESGTMPMTWNELGFRGWKAADGTFRLRITWYDPAAREE